MMHYGPKVKLDLPQKFHMGPFKYYVSKEVSGWGQKMAIFADLQYYLCWRRWVGLKKLKTCWRNIWMVPIPSTIKTQKNHVLFARTENGTFIALKNKVFGQKNNFQKGLWWLLTSLEQLSLAEFSGE